MRALYGAIEHPLIEDLVKMILDYADECTQKYGAEFKWEDLVL